MKKSIEVFFLLIVGVFYLFIVSGLSLPMVEVNFIIGILLDLVAIILRVCCVLVVFSVSGYKENNKANFMAVSLCLLSVLTIINMTFDIYSKNNYLVPHLTWICRYLFEMGQLITISTCVFFINEESDYLKKAFLLGGSILGLWLIVSYFLISEFGIKWVKAYNEIRLFFYIFMLVSVISLIFMSQQTVKKVSKIERKYFRILLIVELVEVLLLMEGHSEMGHFIILVQSFIQCVFSVFVLMFIDETTYGVMWKKVELDLREKEDQVLKGLNEQKRLESASFEIKRNIDEMTASILKMEKEIIEKYEGKDLTYLQKIKDNCDRLNKLNHNVVLLSKLDSDFESENLSFQIINLTAFVKEIINSLEPYMNEKHLQLDFMASSNEIIAEVNPEGIERVIINLISNAVKYNKPNGRINVVLSKKKNQVFLSVRDTGIGISEEDIETVFERFERVQQEAKGNEEGSGLGLAIVKTLVAMHGGKISIASKVDIGTVICVRLPIKQES